MRTNFDFKEWSDLYKNDPDTFELQREAMLENYIATVAAENRHALEQTLFRIKMVRQRAKSPLQSAIEASKLMWESLGKLQDQVKKLEEKLHSSFPANDLRVVKQSRSTFLESKSDQKTSFCVQEPKADTAITAQILPFKASNKSAH